MRPGSGSRSALEIRCILRETSGLPSGYFMLRTNGREWSEESRSPTISCDKVRLSRSLDWTGRDVRRGPDSGRRPDRFDLVPSAAVENSGTGAKEQVELVYQGGDRRP